MKTGEVLTLRSFKTRAKNKAKNTEEFCQITSLITSLEDRRIVRNPVNFCLWNYIPGLEREPLQELDTREQVNLIQSLLK